MGNIKIHLKMNKKGLEFKLMFFAIVAFSLVILSIGMVLSGWNDFYDSNLEPDLDQFSRLNEISQVAQQQQESISPQTSDPGSDFEANTFRGGFGIISTIINSLGVLWGVFGLVYELGNRFGVLTFILQGVVVMMVFAIITAIIAIIFRLARPNA